MVVQELIAKLGFDVDQGGMRKVDNGLSSLIKQVGLLAAAWKAVGLVIDSVKGAANLESMNAEFEVMLGNADAARYLVQQIQQFAAETPFETEGLARGAKTMMAFGISANDALRALRFIGDVAGADQERMSRMIMTYSQVMALGRLQGDNLREFATAGFNPLETIAEKTGKSMTQLRKDMEKGAISADMVRQAFETVTGPGGRFFGNMEKQSQTLNGLWSTMIDNVKILMAELGGRLVPFVKQVIIGIIELSDPISDAYRQLADFFGIMLSDGPTALDTAAGIAAALMTIADAIMLVGSVGMGIWSILQGLFGAVMALVTGAIMVFTAPFAVLLKVVSFVEEKLGTLMRAIGLVKLGNWFTKDSISADMGAEAFMAPARFTGTMAGDSFTAAGKSWDKAETLFGMVGQSKPRAPGTKQDITAAILAALEGGRPVVHNNVNTDITIHADGSLKDILKEQANDIIGTAVLATRLRAAAV